MIIGRLESGRPTILAQLLVPRLRLRRHIKFLVDTGADTSLIHPSDMFLLGIQPQHFAAAVTINSGGVGGSAGQYVEPCELILDHDDGASDRLPVVMRFAMRSQANIGYPSLLGRDVLRHYTLTFSEAAGLVTLTPPI